MPALWEEDEEMLTEILEGYNDERWEESNYDESIESDELEAIRRWPRYTRQRGSIVRPVRPAMPVGGAAGATIRTPAGEARVHFPKALSTQESVNARVKELKSDIARNAIAIKKIESTLDKNTAVLDKKINTVGSDMKKNMQQMQMMMILPMLMKPEITKITFAKAPEANTATDVTKTEHKDGMMMLLPLMMMSGGFGGSGTDSTGMMIMALAMSGALGSK